MTNTEQIVECIRKYEVRVVTNNADIFILAQNFFSGCFMDSDFSLFFKRQLFFATLSAFKVSYYTEV